MPTDLLRKCNYLLGGGMDFPTLWHEVIKGHPLVTGVPIQGIDDKGRLFVEIPLGPSQSIIVHHDDRTATLLRGELGR